MSKMDAQRAMREARYAANQKAAAGGATARAGRPAAPKTGAATGSKAATAPTTSTTPAADAEACGHRSMNGRTCTRPAGHAEKNHRYG